MAGPGALVHLVVPLLDPQPSQGQAADPVWGRLHCAKGLSTRSILRPARMRWGDQVLNWRMVRLVLSPARELWLKAAYRRHAVKTVVTARHVMGLRAAAFLTAGIARVPFWKFIVADVWRWNRRVGKEPLNEERTGA